MTAESLNMAKLGGNSIIIQFLQAISDSFMLNIPRANYELLIDIQYVLFLFAFH